MLSIFTMALVFFPICMHANEVRKILYEKSPKIMNKVPPYMSNPTTALQDKRLVVTDIFNVIFITIASTTNFVAINYVNDLLQ